MRPHKTIPLYWHCQYCGTPHEVAAKQRPRRYCNRKCQNAAYYQRKRGTAHATTKSENR